MLWMMLGVLAAAVVAAWAYQLMGPRVPVEQVAAEDSALVRENDRGSWRRLSLRRYRRAKQQDDFYRIAAYRKKVAGGMPEPEAKAAVRKEFPFFYLDPAERDIEGYDGDDGALPVVLRDRIHLGSRVLKQLMGERGASFRTMNALIRMCLRKGAL